MIVATRVDQVFKDIVETIREPLLVLDSDLKIVLANRSFINTFKTTSEQTLGKLIYDLGDKQWDIPRLRELLETILAGKTSFENFEVKHDFATIGSRIMLLNARQIERGMGKEQIILLAIEDITKRKRLEERMEMSLLESEGRYRLLTQNSLTGIYIHIGGLLKFVNNRFSEMLGYAPEEIIGRQYWDFIHPEDREMVRDISMARARGEAAPPEYEFRHQSKDGKTLWVHNLATIIQYQGQTANMGNLAQINDRKRAEEEKDKLQAQFHQAQKMESVGRLAGGVAHDYNNMLSVIIGYTELALEKMAPTDPIHGDLQEIYTAAGRAKEITRQLLAFARKQTIAPKVLDLNTTVEGMLNMLRQLIGEDIDLAWLPDTDLWPVKMDPSQLDQIIANLCVNARDAITGVGKISVETQNATLDEACCANYRWFVAGDFVVLAVSDDGCGMDKENQEKIFEPFFTTKEAGKGTGLGLATVYGIVKQNDGFINVYSEPGNGTTFRIYLPRYEGMTADAIKEKTTPIPKGEGEWTLVVEDDNSVLKLAEKILNGLGYTVLTARTRGEAMDLVDRHARRIQLLLIDVVMPGMNGRELANRIQALCPDLKTLFMSGYTRNVIVHRGVLDEGVNFIQKPFSINGMATAVRKLLDE